MLSASSICEQGSANEIGESLGFRLGKTVFFLLPGDGTHHKGGVFRQSPDGADAFGILLGFAAGVMVAASVWSLIIPAMDQSAHMGKLAFLPAFVGVWAGFGFLLLLDKLIPHMHLHDDCPEGIQCNLGKSTMMVLAVALHNLPEGMAVGVVAAGWLTGSESISYAGALALSLGIALQNLPEGAIISLPLKSQGMKSGRAFLLGAASGAVEPVGAVLTLTMVLITGGYKDMDMLSIGPNMVGIHTPAEQLSVSSAERVYRLLLHMLASIR